MTLPTNNRPTNNVDTRDPTGSKKCSVTCGGVGVWRQDGGSADRVWRHLEARKRLLGIWCQHLPSRIEDIHNIRHQHIYTNVCLHSLTAQKSSTHS